MKNVSLRGFSILGLLLIATSAVIAAVLPSYNKEVHEDQLGTLKGSSTGTPGIKTCNPTFNPGNNTCNVSATTNTTILPYTTSTENPNFPEEVSTSEVGGDSAANTALN